MILKYYLRLLSVAYLIGALFHLADIFDLRLLYSEMNLSWKIWIIYLVVMDSVASVGLWKLKTWGVTFFMLIAVSQLVAYLRFADTFGRQDFLVWFHVVTLIGYFAASAFDRKMGASFSGLGL